MKEKELNTKLSEEEMSDAELEALGIEIPAEETDGSFFDRIDRMIEEVFNEES